MGADGSATLLTCRRRVYYLAIVAPLLLLSLFAADGFLSLSTSQAQRKKQPTRGRWLLSSSSSAVAPPENVIDTNTLLYQAYTTLTVTEVRDLLRQCGAKITGNKSQLIDRLGELLNGKKTNEIEEDKQRHPQHVVAKAIKQKTLKELESVQRVLISGLADYEKIHQADDDGDVDAPISDNREWQILEPSIRLCKTFTSAEKLEIILGEEGTFELPFLSGLLFVNKNAGISTLPTKDELYPCLSDSVKEWLEKDPLGQARLKQAQLDEERWWDDVLKIEPQNSKQRRQLKKRIRQREKQLEKIATFEARPAHRLDIDTSGIVCIALTPNALSLANMLFERKSRRGIEENFGGSQSGGVEKRYVALLEGSMDKDASVGVISHAIGKVWVDDHHEWACDVRDDGSFAFIRHNGSSDTKFVPDTLREATTSYEAVDWSTVETNGDSKSFTRVSLTPHTGRGHQLRLHMASLQHPIVGDDMHGKECDLNKQVRLCLHASELSLDSFCFCSNYSLQKCHIVVESVPPF